MSKLTVSAQPTQPTQTTTFETTYPLLAKERFEYPDNFCNFSNAPIEDFYVVATKCRDSHILDESNFDAIVKRLAAIEPKTEIENENKDAILEDGWYTYTASHWGVGWVESIMVSPNANPELLAECEKILKELADYPVLDDDDFSEREDEHYAQLWQDLTPTERWETLPEPYRRVGRETKKHKELPHKTFTVKNCDCDYWDTDKAPRELFETFRDYVE